MAKPNLDKESRTIVPGIWGDALRTYDSLPAGRLLTTTLTQTEIAILEGDFFRAYRRYSIPSLSTVYIKFTPPTTRAFGLVGRDITPEFAGVKYYVFAGATGVVTVPDSEWQTFNENGFSSNAPEAMLQDVSSVADEGVESDYAVIPVGASGKTSGSLERREGFKIIAQELLVKIENLESKPNEVLIYYQWIEAPAQVAGI